jgi:hypothetical protein
MEMRWRKQPCLAEHVRSELPQGDDFFPAPHLSQNKTELKPKPAPESPRPGAADSGGQASKSALAEFVLRMFQKSCGENPFECCKGII